MSKNETGMRRIYKINDNECKKCGLCKRFCPAEAIEGKIKESFFIDTAKCINCGICVSKCKFNSIDEVYIQDKNTLNCRNCGNPIDAAINSYISKKVRKGIKSYELCPECRVCDIAEKISLFQLIRANKKGLSFGWRQNDEG